MTTKKENTINISHTIDDLSDLTTITSSAAAGTDLMLVYDVSDDNFKKMTITELTTEIGSTGLSYDGSTANGVLTYKDADEISVESNLTFDGSTLGLTGDLTVSGTITMASELIHDGDTNNKIGFGTDTQTFTTAGTARMFIGSGNIGINTSSPVSKFHIDHVGYDFDGTSGDGGDGAPEDGDFHLMLKDTNNSTAGDAVSIGFAQSSDGTTVGAKISHVIENSFSRGSLVFSTNNTASAGDTTVERMRIRASGLVGIGVTSPTAQLHVDYGATAAPSLTWNTTAGQIFRNENSEFAFGLYNTGPWPLWIQGRTHTNGARNIALNPLGGEITIGTPTAESGDSNRLTVDGSISAIKTGATGGIGFKMQNNEGKFFMYTDGGNFVIKDFQVDTAGSTDGTDTYPFKILGGSATGSVVVGSKKLGVNIDPPVAGIHVNTTGQTYSSTGVMGSAAYFKAAGDQPMSLVLDSDGTTNSIVRTRYLNAGTTKWQHNVGADIQWYYDTGGNGSWNERLKLTSAGDLSFDGDITIGGNDIKSSGGTTALTLSGANVTVSGALTVIGGEIDLGSGKGQTSDLAVGWWTIAVVKGDEGAGSAGQRGYGEFLITDDRSSRHGAWKFSASHFFGYGNQINVTHASFYGSTKNLTKIRIKDSGTYAGAALQVYVANAQNAFDTYMFFSEHESDGWTLLDTWLLDTETGGAHDALVGDDSESQAWADFAVDKEVNLEEFDTRSAGGFYTSGGMYAKQGIRIGADTEINLGATNSYLKSANSASDVTLSADDDLIIRADDDISFSPGGSRKAFFNNSGNLILGVATDPQAALEIRHQVPSGNDASTLTGKEFFRLDSIDDGGTSGGPGYSIRIESTSDHNHARFNKTIMGDLGSMKIKNMFGNWGYNEYWLANSYDGYKQIARLYMSGTSSENGTSTGNLALYSSGADVSWANNAWSSADPSSNISENLRLSAGATSFINGGNLGIGTTSPDSDAKLQVHGNMNFGQPGGGGNTNGGWFTIEGNADSSGEGSGRIFFREHNNTTGAMSKYGMSLGYRGGATTITGGDGNDWTGLGNISNGEWGMWGHDNSATGSLIMRGSRTASYLSFPTPNVLIGAGTSPVSKLQIMGDTTIYNGSSESHLILRRNATGTNYGSAIKFKFGDSDNSSSGHEYARLTGNIEDSTDGEERGYMAFNTARKSENGNLVEAMRINDLGQLVMHKDSVGTEGSVIRMDADINTLQLIHGDYSKDASRMNKTITTSNATFNNARAMSGTKKFDSRAVYFSSAISYVTTPLHGDFNFGTGDFTIEAWVQFDDQPGGSSAMSTICEIGAYNDGILLRYDHTNDKMQTYLSSSTQHESTSLTLPTDIWFHVALCRDDGTVKLFIDGILFDSWTDTTNLTPNGVSPSTGNGIIWGQSAHTTGEQSIKGWMDEMRISDVARYKDNFTPPSGPFSTVSAETLQRTNALDTTLQSWDNRLGMGTTTPQHHLDIWGRDPSIRLVDRTDDSGSSRIILGEDSSVTEATEGNVEYGWELKYNSTGNDFFELKMYDAGNSDIDNALVVDRYGKVGIADASPSYKLDVNGNFRAKGDMDGYAVIENTGTDQSILASHTGSSTPVPWDIRESSSSNNNDAPYGVLHLTRMNMNADGAGANLHFRTKKYDSGTPQEVGGIGATIDTGLTSNATVTGSLHFYTTDAGSNRQEKMTIKSTGNVGIGVTAPVPMLHVKANNGTTDMNSAGAAGITIEQDGAGDAAFSMLLSGTRRWMMGIDNSDSDKLKFATGGTSVDSGTALTIDTSGNVGIGDTSPSFPLDVNGWISTTNGLVHTGDTNNTIQFETDIQKFNTAGTTRMTIAANGDVTVAGAFAANTKSFDIEHPTKEGKRLHHGSLEGPEHGVYIRGKNNSGTIHLPDYWKGLVDEDSITVQLTAIGKPQELYVREIKNNRVRVAAKTRGTHLNYFYFIQAERKDVEKMVVEYDV